MRSSGGSSTRPLATMRATMARVGRGELDARVPVGATRRDRGARRDAQSHARPARIAHARSERAGAHARPPGCRTANVELVSSRQRVLALRQALARAEQLAAVGHMAANLAHEVGTPLNLVSGYVQMLLEDADREPQHRRAAAASCAIRSRASPASCARCWTARGVPPKASRPTSTRRLDPRRRSRAADARRGAHRARDRAARPHFRSCSAKRASSSSCSRTSS